MIDPAAERLRMLHSRVADGRGLAQAVSDPSWMAGARILKRDVMSSVLSGRVRIGDRDVEVVVKSMTQDRVKDRLSRLVGVTRGLRQWRGAEYLTSRGFSAAPGLVLFRSRGADGVERETIVTERVPGSTLLHHMAQRDLSIMEERVLAAHVGAMARGMIEAGLFNRDNKPSNIIVQRDGSGALGLVWIDTVGVRRISPWKGGAGNERLLARMLASLVIEPMGVGCLVEVGLLWRGLCAAVAEREHDDEAPRLWEVVERIVHEHGDPTPRVNPLDAG